MIGTTRDPKKTHLLFNLRRKNYDSNDLDQMSYKQDLSDNIFDLQSHQKKTAAFVVNKFFFITTTTMDKTFESALVYRTTGKF